MAKKWNIDSWPQQEKETDNVHNDKYRKSSHSVYKTIKRRPTASEFNLVDKSDRERIQSLKRFKNGVARARDKRVKNPDLLLE